MYDYEITAQLILNIDKADEALNAAIKKINELEGKVKSSTSNGSKYNKKFSESYEDLNPNIEKLTSNLNENHKANDKLMKGIEKTHKSLLDSNATVDKANKVWKRFADENGLAFRNGRLVGSIRDMDLEMKTLGNTTSNVTNAQTKFKTEFDKLQTSLRKGVTDTTGFDKSVRNLANSIQNEFGVKVRYAGDGLYEFGEKIDKTSSSYKNTTKALKDYTKALNETKNVMSTGGNFTKAMQTNLYNYRQQLGKAIFGETQWNKILKETKSSVTGNSNTYPELKKAVRDLANNNKIGTAEANKFIKAMDGWNKTLISTGGNLNNLMNRSGNFNKVLTQITRSQRMQNYAMQVSAMRYNALSTAVGFLGGVMAQQLLFGFANARMESIKFEQQAQQMLKTTKLTTVEIKRLDKAVSDYTARNRKLNTAGLKYTVAQVAKLNNLTEAQATKAIPVIADMTNMMVLNGRSQEEAILAVNDALDGQFKRLQEIGVRGKDQLEELGYKEGDVNSLLNALQKISETKGWHDLTADISTLDDAYAMLGNTIDDVLTPAFATFTPYIVQVIQSFASLMTTITNLPTVLQIPIAGIGVLGAAFAKMKIEMFKAKMVGSEFMARITGLDDDMINITKSVGGVKVALKEGTINIEEASTALANYHYQTYGFTRGTVEMGNEISNLSNEIAAEKEALDNLTGSNRIFAENQIKQKEILRERIKAEQVALNNAVNYDMKMKDLNVTDKYRIKNLQQLIGATDEEMRYLALNTDLLVRDADGRINLNNILKSNGESYDLLSGKIDKNTIKTANSNIKTNKTLTLNKLRRKSNEDVSRAILGLCTVEELENTKLDENTVKTLANKLETQGVAKGKKAETLARDALATTIVKENVELEENILLDKAEKVAVDSNTRSQEVNNLSRKGFFGRVKQSTKALIQNTKAFIKNTAAEIANFAAANPLLTGAIVIAVVAVTSALKDLVDHQLQLNSALGEYNKILTEGAEEIERLEKEKADLQAEGKDVTALTNRIDKLNEKYKETQKINDGSIYAHDTSLSYIDTYADKTLNKIKSVNGANYDYSQIAIARNEIEKLNKVETDFAMNTVKRDEALRKTMQNSGKDAEEQTRFLEDYRSAQIDVVESLEKMKSDDFMTRLGGYWDNFWARMKMGWIEAWADIGSWFNDLPNIISGWFSKIDWAGMADWLISGWNNLFGGMSKWLEGAMANDDGTASKNIANGLGNIIHNGIEYLINNREGIANMAINLLKFFLELFLYLGTIQWELVGYIGSCIGGYIENGFNNAKDYVSESVSSFIDWLISSIMWHLDPSNWGTIAGDKVGIIAKAIGLDDETVSAIEEKVKSLVDTITYWLNPANWVIEGGNAIDNWWNSTVAEPLKYKLALLGIDLHTDGSKAGGELKSGLKQGSNGSDTAVSNNLNPITGLIGKFGGIFGSKAHDAGGNVKSGIKTGSSGASSPVKDEMNYINSIMNSYGGMGGSFFKTASGVASAIISGIKSGLNQHSPGDASKIVLKEMEYTIAFMEEQKPIIEESAKGIGKAIVTGMSDVSSLDTSVDMSALLEQAKYIADTQLATETLKSQVTTNNNAIMTSNSQMGNNTQSEFTDMQQTVDGVFMDMSNTAKTSLLNIAQTNTSQINKVANDTNTGMTNAHNTMNTKLKGMQNTTLLATNSMTHAWGVMKNNIVKSADDIRSQSYSKFNSLHKSISSFYKQIQSANFSFGALAAGSPKLGGSRSVRHTPITSNGGSGFKGFSSNMKRFGTASLADDEDYLKIMKNVLNGRAKRSDIEALYKKDYFNRDGYYFGGIDTNAHVNKQLNYAYDWRMKSPSMYGINLGMNDMTVGDFRDGKSSPFTYSNFEHYLTMLLTARGFRNPSSYDFYWNSQRSNQQVWDSVSCNCCDGAELIVEIAKDMGLNNATTIHGHWGSLGHVGAKVGGKVYDMTQFQHRGIFRGHPSVSWGGSYNGNPALLGAGKPNKGKPIRWGSVKKSYGTGGNTTNNKSSINITVTGNTFIGEKDYKNKIRQISKNAAEEVFYEMHGSDGAVGY